MFFPALPAGFQSSAPAPTKRLIRCKSKQFLAKPNKKRRFFQSEPSFRQKTSTRTPLSRCRTFQRISHSSPSFRKGTTAVFPSPFCCTNTLCKVSQRVAQAFPTCCARCPNTLVQTTSRNKPPSAAPLITPLCLFFAPQRHLSNPYVFTSFSKKGE